MEEFVWWLIPSTWKLAQDNRKTVLASDVLALLSGSWIIYCLLIIAHFIPGCCVLSDLLTLILHGHCQLRAKLWVLHCYSYVPSTLISMLISHLPTTTTPSSTVHLIHFFSSFTCLSLPDIFSNLLPIRSLFSVVQLLHLHSLMTPWRFDHFHCNPHVIIASTVVVLFITLTIKWKL